MKRFTLILALVVSVTSPTKAGDSLDELIVTFRHLEWVALNHSAIFRAAGDDKAALAFGFRSDAFREAIAIIEASRIDKEVLTTATTTKDEPIYRNRHGDVEHAKNGLRRGVGLAGAKSRLQSERAKPNASKSHRGQNDLGPTSIGNRLER